MTVLPPALMFSRSPRFSQGLDLRRAARPSVTVPLIIALLALLSLVLPSPTLGEDADLTTVLNGSRQRIEKLDYRANGRLTKITPDGKRTNYKFVAKAHWFPDGLRMLFEVSGAGAEKTTLLLHLTANGRLTIDARLPASTTPSALPFEHWSDPLMGTDFSYEDLAEEQFFWKGQELLAPAKFGARDCFLLKSTSAAQDRTSYSSVTSWIDRTNLFPVQEVKTMRGTGQQKQFVSFGLRQHGGSWSASQVEAKLVGKPGSSLLVIEGGTPKANLSAKDFVIGPSAPQSAKAK